MIDSDLDNHAQPTLDIIIPCFNPSLEWEKQLTHYIQELSNHLQEISIQFILVNDGSNNNRFTEIETNYLKTEFPPIKIVANPVNLGKGAALRLGVSHAKSEFQIFTDIDFPYTIPSIIAVYKELILGTDVALGYRKRDYYEKVPFARKVISRLLRWLLKSILRLPITDTQCGLKGFNNKGKAIFLETTINRFLFDLEFVKTATLKRQQLKVIPVSVTLRSDVVFSIMNYKVLLVESINFVRLLFSK